MYMLIEHLAGQIESIEKEIEASRYNKVNIDHLKEQVDMLQKIKWESLMEQMVIALLMLVNNEIKEARLQPDLSTCLKGKRIANRDISDNVEYRCIKSMAELEDNIDGSQSIKKLILINYSLSL